LEKKKRAEKANLMRRKIVMWFAKVYRRDKHIIQARKVERCVAKFFAKKYLLMKARNTRHYFCKWIIKKANAYWLKGFFVFGLVKKYYVPYKRFMDGQLT